MDNDTDVCKECKAYGDDYEMYSDGTIYHCCEECVFRKVVNEDADKGRAGRTFDNRAKSVW